MDKIEKLENIIAEVQKSSKYKNKQLILNFLELKLLKTIYED